MRTLFSLGCALAMLTACSSGAGDTADATTVPTPPTPATTATPTTPATTATPTTSATTATPTTSATTATPTTATPTTTPATSTTPTTVAESTVPEPTTETTTTQPRATEELIAEFRARVEADWREGERLLSIALADPTDQAAVDAALARLTDGALNGIGHYIDGLNERGWRVTESEEVPWSLTVLQGPDPVDGLTAEATMIYCEIDSTIVLEVGADGSETIVNDDIYTEWWDALFRWNGEIWQLAGLVPIDTQDGIVPCA